MLIVWVPVVVVSVVVISIAVVVVIVVAVAVVGMSSLRVVTIIALLMGIISISLITVIGLSLSLLFLAVVPFVTFAGFGSLSGFSLKSKFFSMRGFKWTCISLCAFACLFPLCAFPLLAMFCGGVVAWSNFWMKVGVTTVVDASKPFSYNVE